MLVLLPLLAFLLLLVGFRCSLEWRAAFLTATIPWALFVAFFTELLTRFRSLTLAGVACGWFVFTLICLLWTVREWRAAHSQSISKNSTPLPWSDRAALCVIAGVVLLVGVAALASAPNNWDAMEYHLPRVIEWIGNHGVQFYPTIDWSQLCQPPFAEYTMLHLDLLSGSDRLLALVQWFSYVGFIVGATLIARELGGDPRSEVLAAVFAATFPSAVLGASSTKNDCVAAYWVVVAAYYLLRWRQRQDWPHTLAIGAAVGMAVFTKGTSYIFLPCVVLACGMPWTAKSKRRFLLRLPAIAALPVLICLPLWVRNYQFSGSPLGLPYFYGVGDVNGRMFNTAHVTPAETAANLLRNVALHVGVPNERINALSTRGFSGAMHLLGVDPNDPGQVVASQFGYTPRFEVRFTPKNEVLTEDPIHLLLFLLALALWFPYRRQIGPATGWFGLGIVGAFVLYSALLRWSPWNARYQIPLFALAAAFSAVVLEKSLPKWSTGLLAAILLLFALPLALGNDARPLITRHGLTGSTLTTPRDETYFFDAHRQLAPSWIAAASTARNSSCRAFGLDANRQHFEYPMMALLLEDGVPRRIRYVDVENSSARYAKPSSQPLCAVICLNCLHDGEKLARYSATLSRRQSFGSVVLFSQPENLIGPR